MSQKFEQEKNNTDNKKSYEVKILQPKDRYYPKQLLNIKDYPKKLYVIGNEKILNNRCLAIVGSRNATNYGLKNAQRFANAFSYIGITVVSGLAIRNR